MSTRRIFLTGFAACVPTMVAIVAAIVWIPKRGETVRYEQGMAKRFKDGAVSVDVLALTHLAGFSSRQSAWLLLAREAEPKRDWDGLERLFETLLSGDVERIEAAVQAVHPYVENLARGNPNSVTLEEVVDALTLLGRGDVVAALHAKSLQRLGPGQESSLTVTAVLALAQAGDWPHALEILEEARRMRAVIPIALGQEKLLFKYAYLHGEIERAAPVLAQAPFPSEQRSLVEHRAWELKAYEIRAGIPGIDMPVIELNQPNGYEQAAAMQIAALEDDPAAADLVRNLHRVLKPKTTEVIHADSSFHALLDAVEDAFSKARAQIAAKRKNYGRAADLARASARSLLINPANDVINAFLEEGNWRAAADIAKDHDPRRGKVIAGLLDTRVEQYVDLYIRFGIAAAWSGDDSAAAEFLAAAEHADWTDPNKDADDDHSGRFLWLKTVLAGAAEGLLPRRYLNVVTRGFLMPI
jgi:hypothetical protein